MNSIQGYSLFVETLKNGELKEIYEKLYVLRNELYRIKIKHIEEFYIKKSMTIGKYKKNEKLYNNILVECIHIKWFLKRTIDEMWFKHLLSINHKNAKFVKNVLN